MLKTFIIEPRDSVIFRDGRPFGSEITQAVSVDFPFPSTIAGGLRTRFGTDPESGHFSADPDEVRKVSSYGTLLVELDDSGSVSECYLPTPADALLIQDSAGKAEGEARLLRLLPLEIAGTEVNLDELLPVGLARTDIVGKPFSDLKFWRWSKMTEWLEGSQGADSKISVEEHGIGSLGKDSRFHVAISAAMSAEHGALFQTRGLEFRILAADGKIRQFALATFVGSDTASALVNKPVVMPLGGERRLVFWRANENPIAPMTCPASIKASIVKAGGYCRVVLLTPAYFVNGFQPASDGGLEVVAVACGRYQTVSGWDFAAKRPKPTRRLMPAGSVLFAKITADDVGKFIDDNWFRCLSDVFEGQSFSNDGFGLAVFGTWDGNSVKEFN